MARAASMINWPSCECSGPRRSGCIADRLRPSDRYRGAVVAGLEVTRLPLVLSGDGLRLPGLDHHGAWGPGDRIVAEASRSNESARSHLRLCGPGGSSRVTTAGLGRNFRPLMYCPVASANLSCVKPSASAAFQNSDTPNCKCFPRTHASSALFLPVM